MHPLDLRVRPPRGPRERLGGLYAAAGLRLTRILPTTVGVSLIEGQPA